VLERLCASIEAAPGNEISDETDEALQASLAFLTQQPPTEGGETP
jgi:hypothetical protein